MNIFARLEQPDFRPSKADQRLINFIKEHAEKVPVLSIADLAQAVGVAESTVTRFVKKLGFANLRLFKVQLTAELTQYRSKQIIHSDIALDEPVPVTGRKLLDAYYETLERTLVTLPPGVIAASADLLQQAKKIFFVGIGNSGFTACDAAYKFFRIGLSSEGCDNSHTMMIQAALAEKGVVFAAISHSGETQEVVKTIRLAKEREARILAITAERDSTLAQMADIVVPYAGHETLLETGSVSVKMAQMFILDFIYTQIVKERGEAAVEKKRLTALAIKRLHEQA